MDQKNKRISFSTEMARKNYQNHPVTNSYHEDKKTKRKLTSHYNKQEHVKVSSRY